MMFLLRSAFWLSIVYAHMPFDGDEARRAIDQTRSALVTTAANAATEKCVQDAAPCRAILGAAAAIVAPPSTERASAPGAPPRAIRQSRSGRPSGNSLTAGDMGAPWRGRPARSGA